MVIYNSGDSQNLISALETNLSGAQQIFDRLSKGSQHLIGVLDSGTLSGAAYNAGKNLFVAYINPMLQKLNQAISDIQGDLRAYKSADSAVSRYGTHLDSDQIEHLLRLTNHMIQLLEDKIRSDKDFINNFLSGGFEKVGGALAELPQLYEQLDNLKEIKATRENELRALEEFKYTTNSLFKDSAKAFDSAMKGVAIINQSSASADGTITFPAGADMSWLKKLSNEKFSSSLLGSKNKSKTDKLTEQQLEAFLKDGGKLMVYKDRARVKTANQNDLASDVSFADADVVIWYIVKDGVVIKLSEHPEFKDLSNYLQKKGGKLKKDQYTPISYNQAEEMLVDSMDGLAGNVARFEYYFRPVENALAGLVAAASTTKAVQKTGNVPYGDMDTAVKNKNPDYLKLKNTENFKNNTTQHILGGEINKKGKAVGYHTENNLHDDLDVKLKNITSPDEFGVYKANVEINGTTKNSYSTFFPKDWGNQKIINEINHAYKNMKPTGKAGIFKGTASNGVEITIKIKNGKIDTAFPFDHNLGME